MAKAKAFDACEETNRTDRHSALLQVGLALKHDKGAIAQIHS